MIESIEEAKEEIYDYWAQGSDEPKMEIEKIEPPKEEKDVEEVDVPAPTEEEEK